MGYDGAYSTLTEYLRLVRPPVPKVFDRIVAEHFADDRENLKRQYRRDCRFVGRTAVVRPDKPRTLHH
ncbi:hypothetical protein AA12717_2944 [Gluconacetobacter sacchari DSM 12717]|uniref:Uncharacterized protein n=2 Tax=Gluconacetobacter sacchari TaxID=92759 RepID=A0ABQ0PA88_9PROT|nr:hypothetical protein AA12717_2944 [Gluconacetobacter sacchari DSM 12717]